MREDQWWRKRLWKIQIPLKTIITMWLAFSNKLLTWEMLQKRGFERLGLCTLCRSSDETSSHLFALCPYEGRIWMGVTDKLTIGSTHERTTSTLEKRTKTWWLDEGVGS